VTKVKDKEIIDELKAHGYTQRGAKNALVGIKKGMEDIRKGRIHRIKRGKL